MKTDFYTKTVLTVIALCLVFIVFKHADIFPSAYAGQALDVKSGYGLVPLNEDGSINVRISQGQIMDVRLRAIDKCADCRWESLKVSKSEF